MPNPFSLLLFLFALTFLIAFAQVGLLTIAFDKLGLSQSSAFLLLLSSLGGSLVNLPLFRIRSAAPRQEMRDWSFPPWLQRPPPERTVIALNVGGGLIPVAFSFYLLRNNPLPVIDALLGVALVSAISYLFSRPVPGMGIGMPILVAPVTAALVAILLNPEYSAPLAYVSGTLGVLVGADILHLKDIRRLGTPVASIGGAGTFDGIFITGVIAVLLA